MAISAARFQDAGCAASKMRGWPRTGGFVCASSKVSGPIRCSPTWTCVRDFFESSMNFAAVQPLLRLQVTMFLLRVKHYAAFKMPEHLVSWSCCTDCHVE